MERESLSFTSALKQLPDVAREAFVDQDYVQVDWVGMSSMEILVAFRNREGQSIRLPGQISTAVNLVDNNSRGIHMSRLYRLAQEAFTSQDLSFQLLAKLLTENLQSHIKLSTRAKIELDVVVPIQRRSLISENMGWRNYPWKLQALVGEDLKERFYFEFKVVYSSTCPASAALSRQLIQENFKEKFLTRDLDFKSIYEFLGTTEGIIATPHAQRSEARVKIEVEESFTNFMGLIDLVEGALKTPVQTAVKREDEQEFALRNGQNLMFCEDAARKIKSALLNEKEILDFVVQIQHFESLHPHNAMSVISNNKELRGFEW